MSSGKVVIHGREYKTVALRVAQFRSDHPDWTIATEILQRDDEVVLIRATILETSGRLIAVGHAEEKRTASRINRTSAVENCETSAVGRALAAAGYGGDEYASADEVAEAIMAGAKEEPPRHNPAKGEPGTLSEQLALARGEARRIENDEPVVGDPAEDDPSLIDRATRAIAEAESEERVGAIAEGIKRARMSQETQLRLLKLCKAKLALISGDE